MYKQRPITSYSRYIVSENNQTRHFNWDKMSITFENTKTSKPNRNDWCYVIEERENISLSVYRRNSKFIWKHNARLPFPLVLLLFRSILWSPDHKRHTCDPEQDVWSTGIRPDWRSISGDRCRSPRILHFRSNSYLPWPLHTVVP